MKFPLTAAAASAVALLAAGVAAAQAYGPAPRPRVACAADIQRLCAQAGPGKPAMRCLRGQLARVSPECGSSIQAARARRAQRLAQQGGGRGAYSQGGYGQGGYGQGAPQGGYGPQSGPMGPPQGDMPPQPGDMPPQ